MLDYGWVFKKVRESSRLTFEQFADRLGISYELLYSIETNSIVPGHKLVQRTEEIFGVNPTVYAWARHAHKHGNPMESVAGQIIKRYSDHIESLRPEPVKNPLERMKELLAEANSLADEISDGQ